MQIAHSFGANYYSNYYYYFRCEGGREGAGGGLGPAGGGPGSDPLNPLSAGHLGKVGPTAAAWVGAEVAAGILPNVGTEATSTSYPEQNELNAKV